MEESQQEDAQRATASDGGSDDIITPDGHMTAAVGAEEEEASADEEEMVFIPSSLSPADVHPGDEEEASSAGPTSSTPTGAGPGSASVTCLPSVAPPPPNSLPLSGSRPRRRKVLVAPALSLSLGGSESMDDFPAAFLSPSPEDEDEGDLDIDLDAMETPSDSESLLFPACELEDHLQHLGVGASPGSRLGGAGAGAGPGAGPEPGLGALGQEDVVDKEGSRWRCFCPGEPPQEAWVNMSVLEPFLRVLSHGGYHGDGMNDIIVFSSCFLPENSLENYQYVMDNLFRYVVGTLDLMVAENYVIVYFCAGGQKDKLPGISWLRECYTTIDRRLRKNLKGFYVVHPTWYIKALITIIKPFISSKFSRKLRFVETLQELAELVPLEQLQVPACVRQYDQSASR